MAAVAQLGYVGLGVSDVEKWEHFATDIVGLQVTERTTSGSLLLGMDEYHHRFIVEAGDDDLAFAGWEVKDEQALLQVADQMKAAGASVTWGSTELAEGRRVANLFVVDDPSGLRTEVFYGPLYRLEAPFKSPRPISGFVTGDKGLGHLNMLVDDLKESLTFYMDGLGLRLSDWVEPQPDRGTALSKGAFLRCNPRHHSLAIRQGSGAKRLRHIMLELNSLDDVGATDDLCQDQGVPVLLTLGRHTNDRMVSFYMQTPSGFLIEYGWGGLNIDESTWRVQTHASSSIWGNRPLKT